MIERYGDGAANDLRSEAPGRELSLRDAGLRSRSRPRDGRGSNRPLAAVDDVGRAINPLILHGQTHGGIAQGVGQALLEESYYEPQSGQLLAASFKDYGMPRAGTLPEDKAPLAHQFGAHHYIDNAAEEYASLSGVPMVRIHLAPAASLLRT